MQKTVERSALLSSGIASSDSLITLAGGSTVINLPFWKNLTDDEDDILSDSTEISTSKIVTGKSVACVHLRAKAWAANDLASLLANSNAMDAIGLKVADYWAHRYQKVLTSTLKGVFAATTMKDSVLDISKESVAAGIVSADSMIDAIYLLGDASEQLTGIMMHSFFRKKLAKLDLVETIRDSEGNPLFDAYMGKRIIIDDDLAPEEVNVDSTQKKAYPVYFFGAGSVAYNEGTGIESVETDRDKLAGDDYLITRRQFTMHPRGLKWAGSPAGTTPSNTELATGTNWELVDERKNVPIAKFVARID